MENLSWDQVSTVEVNLPDLPGIQTEVASVRYYPDGPAFAHMIGYVGAVSPADQKAGEPVLNLPSFVSTAIGGRRLRARKHKP